LLILINFEGKNKYRLTNRLGDQIGFAYESSHSFFRFITRQICGSHRPMEITCLDEQQKEMMVMKRPFFFFFSDMEVMSHGLTIGSIHRRFGIIYKKYILRDARGNAFAYIQSPLWRLWTFNIFNLAGHEIGVITKKWGGALKEIFTDADRFGVQLPVSLNDKQKAVVFAAALAIDMDFFDNNNRR